MLEILAEETVERSVSNHLYFGPMVVLVTASLWNQSAVKRNKLYTKTIHQKMTGHVDVIIIRTIHSSKLQEIFVIVNQQKKIVLVTSNHAQKTIPSQQVFDSYLVFKWNYMYTFIRFYENIIIQIRNLQTKGTILKIMVTLISWFVHFPKKMVEVNLVFI